VSLTINCDCARQRAAESQAAASTVQPYTDSRSYWSSTGPLSMMQRHALECSNADRGPLDRLQHAAAKWQGSEAKAKAKPVGQHHGLGSLAPDRAGLSGEAKLLVAGGLLAADA